LELDEKHEFWEKNCIACHKQILIGKGKENEKRLRNNGLTMDEVDELYKMGFTNFQIMGRGRSIFTYTNDLTRYILEPTFIGPLVFKLLIGT
jgi:radical SAM superfamily enzyme with C-terminal helix-hairpin-helix motif